MPLKLYVNWGCHCARVLDWITIICRDYLHAPVGPTHPRNCSSSPGKHIPFFPLFSFICHRYCSFTLLPSARCHHLMHTHTHARTRIYTYTDMHVCTQWLSAWHTHLICHSSKHMHTHAYTFLNIWVTSMAISNHIPHGCHQEGGKITFLNKPNTATKREINQLKKGG